MCLCGAALLVSCGGGGGTIVPPPGAPVVKLSVSSLTFSDQNLNTQSAVQTTTLTNSGNAMLQITGIAISGTNAGDFSQSNTCGANLAAGANCTIGVFFKPTVTGTRTAMVVITDNATGSPQTVSLTGTGISIPFGVNPPAATVLLGATQSFTLTAPGSCTATVGQITVAGTAVSYAVPEALPSSWSDTMTCTSTSDGTKVSVSITLQYPVPTLSSVSSITMGTFFNFSPHPFFTANMPINGSGFLPDTIIEAGPNPEILAGVTPASWNLLGVNLGVDYGGAPWNPGFLWFTASDPATGHGGGTSNKGYLAFVGDQDLLAFNAADMFVLDSATKLGDSWTNTIRKFKIADGSPDGSFTVSGGEGVGIAVDDKTGYVVVFTLDSIQAFDPITNAQKFRYDASVNGIQGGAAKGGWAVFSQYGGQYGPLPTILGCINLEQPSMVFTQSVYKTPYDTPWDFQMTSINGNLTAVVLNVVGAILNTFAIPSALQGPIQSTGSVPLANLEKAGAHDVTLEGWQLQVFNGGTAVILSQYDKLLVYIDLATMKELKRVNLPTALQPFRIGKNESDGSVVVLFADPLNGRTVASVVKSDGTVKPLETTQPFLSTGFQISTDGGNAYWGNREVGVITPNQ
jgi:Cep192 domain 4